MSDENVFYCKCGNLIYLDMACAVCGILKKQQTLTKESEMTTNEKTVISGIVFNDEEKANH